MHRSLALVFLTAAATAQANWLPQSPPSSPGAREGHDLVFDPTTQRALLMLGRVNGLFAAPQYATWDGSTWTTATATSTYPNLAQTFAAACSDGAGAMLMFGGYYPGFGIGGGNPTAYDYTWLVQTTGPANVQLTLLSPPTHPSARQAPNMVLTNQGIVLFGGATANTFQVYGDTWRWNSATWTSLATAVSPPPRFHHAMAFDSARNVVVMFGGAANSSAVLGDTWEFDGVNWQQRFPVHQPSARCSAACVFSPALGRTVLFGGGATNGGSNSDDAWLWDGVDWHPLVSVGAGPAPRQGAAFGYDPVRQQPFLFSGRDGPMFFADSWYLDVVSAPASYVAFGAGCVGPNALVPLLAAAANEVPAVGTTSHLVVTNLPVALTLPVFVLGTSNTFESSPGYPLPLDLGFLGWPGCPQLVSHDVFDAQPTLTGQASIPFTVPPVATVLGFTFHAQVLALFVPTGAAVSNGLTGIVGF